MGVTNGRQSGEIRVSTGEPVKVAENAQTDVRPTRKGRAWLMVKGERSGPALLEL
jgi:hypothetical protein